MDPKGLKVRKWTCREFNGNIYVWYHSENEKNRWELPLIKSIENKELVYHGRNEFYVNCHIQEIPENGADVSHFSAIHREYLFAGVENPDKNGLVKYIQHFWKAAFIGRRGMTEKIVCDNATNFVGANAKLKGLRDVLF
ncbi:cholesterol 7-desaturase-like [Rhagoletis pomonella]|uniref:cholesterol 7-desaturase-like n=1 Tax=Rhagoletis pomonella TaxID=28610 RepID=UPI00177FAECB|nr:cholesterol 7-desaturase-like [Rhagoletis pomonella]